MGSITPEGVRLLRNCRGLTQGQLANLVSVEASLISRIENGSRSITPGMERRLSSELGWNENETKSLVKLIQTWREGRQ